MAKKTKPIVGGTVLTQDDRTEVTSLKKKDAIWARAETIKHRPRDKKQVHPALKR